MSRPLRSALQASAPAPPPSGALVEDIALALVGAMQARHAAAARRDGHPCQLEYVRTAWCAAERHASKY